MGKHKTKTSRAGKNTAYNANKRLQKAKNKGKSENYIKDLELHLSKIH
jgi:hypothetical protein